MPLIQSTLDDLVLFYTLQAPPVFMECYAEQSALERRGDQLLLCQTAEYWPALMREWVQWLQQSELSPVLSPCLSKQEKSLPEDIPAQTCQTWQIEVAVVSDAVMRTLNSQYRQKDTSTDVLTFSLLADMHATADTPAISLQTLPYLTLGQVVLSLDWAKQHAEAAQLPRYLSERLLHGMLHLAGIHHETPNAYDTVVQIQKTLLERIGL